MTSLAGTAIAMGLKPKVTGIADVSMSITTIFRYSDGFADIGSSQLLFFCCSGGPSTSADHHRLPTGS
jgi:hypothetical protein